MKIIIEDFVVIVGFNDYILFECVYQLDFS